MSLGWGTVFQAGMAAWQMYKQNEMLQNSQAKMDSMEDLNKDIGGGDKGALNAAVTDPGKMKPSENYLKVADAGGIKKKSGLGFGSKNQWDSSDPAMNGTFG